MENKSALYTPIFETNNKVLSESAKQLMFRMYMARRDEAIAEINPMIEIWNKEFEEKYPDYFPCDCEDPRYRQYEEWFCDKQDEILDKYNKKHSDLFRLISDRGPDCGDIMMVDKSGEIEFRVYWKLVGYKDLDTGMVTLA